MNGIHSIDSARYCEQLKSAGVELLVVSKKHNALSGKINAFIEENREIFTGDIVSVKRVNLSEIGEEKLKKYCEEGRLTILTRPADNPLPLLQLSIGLFDTAPLFIRYVDSSTSVTATISIDELVRVSVAEMSDEEYELFTKACIDSAVEVAHAEEEREEGASEPMTPLLLGVHFKQISQVRLFRFVVDKVAEIIKSIFEADAAAREEVSAKNREDYKRYDEMRSEILHGEEQRRLRKEKEGETLEDTLQHKNTTAFDNVCDKQERSLGLKPLIAVGA